MGTAYAYIKLGCQLLNSNAPVSSYQLISISFVVRIDRGGWATTTWLIGYADFTHLFMVFSTFFKSLYPSFYITIVYGIILVDIFKPVMNPQRDFSLCNKEFDYSSLFLTSFKRGSYLKTSLSFKNLKIKEKHITIAKRCVLSCLCQI